MQKRIVRIITNSDYLSHTDPLFYKTGILKVHELHIYLLALRAYKHNRSGRLDYPQHTYDTRARHGAVPAYQRLALSQRALSYSVPKAWNTLPRDIQQATSMNLFKKLLKKWLLSRYRPRERSFSIDVCIVVDT